MPVKDWTKIQKKYKGQWVALASDEQTVLAASKNIREAFEKGKKKAKNDNEPIMTRMPERIVAFAGSPYVVV